MSHNRSSRSNIVNSPFRQSGDIVVDMTLSYESAEETRRTRKIESSPAMACGAVIMLLAAVANQIPMGLFRDRDRLGMIFFIVVLPVSVGVGVTLLSGLIGSSHRYRWAVIERLMVIVTWFWVVLMLVMMLGRWGPGRMLYVLMAAALVAGAMLHLLLGWRMWRRGRRFAALQLFALMILLPLSMAAPFFDPDMQGPSGLGLFPFVRVLPALGVPQYPGEFLLNAITSFAAHPAKAVQSALQLLIGEHYTGPALITPIWAAGMMAFLAFLFVRDLVKRPAAERTA